MEDDFLFDGILLPEVEIFPETDNSGGATLTTEVPLNGLLNQSATTTETEDLKPFIKWGGLGLVIVVILLIILKFNR